MKEKNRAERMGAREQSMGLNQQSDETENNGVNKINKHGVILPKINFREEVTRVGQLSG